MFCLNHLNSGCKCPFANFKVYYRYSSNELDILLEIIERAVKIYPNKIPESQLNQFNKQPGKVRTFTKAFWEK